MKVATRKAPDTGLQPASGPVTKPGKSAPVLRPVANCPQLSGSPILTVLTSLNNKQLSGHKKLYRSPFQPPNAHCPHSDCNTSASHLMKSIKARFEPKLRGDLFSHSSDMLTMLWSWCDMHECNETMNHPDSLCLHTHTHSQCMSISTHSVCSMHITCMVSRMSQTTASTISIVYIVYLPALVTEKTLSHECYAREESHHVRMGRVDSIKVPSTEDLLFCAGHALA